MQEIKHYIKARLKYLSTDIYKILIIYKISEIFSKKWKLFFFAKLPKKVHMRKENMDSKEIFTTFKTLLECQKTRFLGDSNPQTPTSEANTSVQL